MRRQGFGSGKKKTGRAGISRPVGFGRESGSSGLRNHEQCLSARLPISPRPAWKQFISASIPAILINWNTPSKPYTNVSSTRRHVGVSCAPLAANSHRLNQLFHSERRGAILNLDQTQLGECSIGSVAALGIFPNDSLTKSPSHQVA